MFQLKICLLRVNICQFRVSRIRVYQSEISVENCRNQSELGEIFEPYLSYLLIIINGVSLITTLMVVLLSQELTIASSQVPADTNRWSNASNESTSVDDYKDERVSL